MRDEIARRRRAAVAWLRQTTGDLPRLTPWAWAADVILALLLAVGALSSALDLPAQDLPGNFIISQQVQFRNGLPESPEAGQPEKGQPPQPPEAAQATAEFRDSPDAAPWELVLVALSALPLATRRRYPLGSFWIIAISALRVYHLGGNPTWTIVASVVAAYSAPTYSRYRNLALASVVVAAALAIGVNSGDLPGLPLGLIMFLLLSSVGLAANVIHLWRQRARTLERDQEANTRAAVDIERARLARELHDVVSHNVSVMVIQAGAARQVLDTAPDLAKEALLAVEVGGRAAMTELRQVIGLLTMDSDGVDLAPQPGLDGLPALVARVRETGVPVELRVEASEVPQGVGLTVYRVVQEALTNAVKHAAGAEVRVDVSRSASVLRVEVTDTGGAPAAGTGSGRGLIGLRERVAVYGGTLTTGHRPTGGFRVLAHIPLDPAGRRTGSRVE